MNIKKNLNNSDFNNLFRLEGKIALITGGGGVLGNAIGKGVGLAGGKVAIADIIEEKAQKSANRLRAMDITSIGLKVDAFDKDSIIRCLDIVEKELGEVDILINAAGGNVKEAIDLFFEGKYKGDYEGNLLNEFEKSLPKKPPWQEI